MALCLLLKGDTTPTACEPVGLQISGRSRPMTFLQRLLWKTCTVTGVGMGSKGKTGEKDWLEKTGKFECGSESSRSAKVSPAVLFLLASVSLVARSPSPSGPLTWPGAEAAETLMSGAHLDFSRRTSPANAHAYCPLPASSPLLPSALQGSPCYCLLTPCISSPLPKGCYRHRHQSRRCWFATGMWASADGD